MIPWEYSRFVQAKKSVQVSLISWNNKKLLILGSYLNLSEGKLSPHLATVFHVPFALGVSKGS